MKSCLIVCSTILCLGATPPALASPEWSDGVVLTRSGEVRGTAVPGIGVLSWKGIPYATPPVGERRWRAPDYPGRWAGVRDATTYGNRCSASEDCLYLNVWRPDTDERHLPVFFYIHGGSNTGGSGQGTWYTVAHHLNAVVVTINYRLGPMGWFLHPALKTGHRKGDSGNFGLLDQIKALQWVKENIRHFGGDKYNVTIAGASAGAQNVSYLMHTPFAKHLFQKAIMESNFPGIRPVSAAIKSSKQVLYNLLVADGTAATALEAKSHVENNMTDGDIRDYFYSKSMSQIRGVYANAYWGGINWGDFYRDDIVSGNTFVPPPVVQFSADRPEFVYTVGDGYVLPDDIDFADFSRGRVYSKPVIVGVTRNENNLWNAAWPFNYQRNKSLNDLVNEAVAGTNPAYGYLQPFFNAIGEGNVDTFKQNYKFATELIDEVDTYIGSHLSARNLVRSTDRGYGRNNVYVYRFDWGSDPAKEYRIPFEDAWVFYVGAQHVAESDFFYQKFFGLADGDSIAAYQYTEDNLPGRQQLSLAMRSYLREFLHDWHGRISKRSDQPVRWLPWTRDRERYLVLDADYESLDVRMSDTGIARSPQALFDAHLAYPNEAVRDFIEYYIMWSWHWNWYPNRSQADPFDTSPGPNALFDPSNP